MTNTPLPTQENASTVEAIGSERALLLTINNAVSEPEALIDLAGRETYVRAGAVYPGVRAPVSADYLEEFDLTVRPQIELAFGRPLRPGISGCSFSIVTIPPERLAVNQRTPHTDENDPEALAFIHYLCSPDHGGTSFFRHRKTGFEQISPDRAPDYNAIVVRELSERAQFAKSTFVVDSDPHFERILTAENRFNRMLVYPCNQLHSGDIRRPDDLSSDPRIGRLTITGFLILEACR